MIDFVVERALTAIELLDATLYNITKNDTLQVYPETKTVSVISDVYPGMLSSEAQSYVVKEYRRTKDGIEEKITHTDGVSYLPEFIETNILTEKQLKKSNRVVLKELNKFQN